MRSIPGRLLAAPLLAALSLALPASAQAAVDLQIVSVKAPGEATAGYPVTVELTLTNAGTTAVADYPVWFFLSPDPAISVFDKKLSEQVGPPLQPGQTAVIPLTATLPADLTPGPWSLGAIVDPLNSLGESFGTLLDNVKSAQPPVQVKVPSPDFAALKVAWAPRAAAGEVVPVAITIENRGVLDGEALVSFFLSTNETISRSDQFVGQTRIRLPAGGALQQVAWVKLPSTIAPARYYLGMWIDADDEVLELREENNIAVSQPADIAGASLGIETSYLPDALVGLPYVRSLVASGGDGPYSWTLETPAQLPEGLSLSAEGLLSGTPTTAGIFSPTVAVTSGQRTARTTLILRAYAATTALVVSTSELPAAVVGQPYQAPLAAAGGTAPYSWKLFAGAPPDGLQLGADGVLKGKPTKVASAKFTVEVRDLSGATNRRELLLRAVDNAQERSGALSIVQAALAPATAQQPYEAKVLPFGGTAPYRWTLAEGRLPHGLALSRDPVTTPDAVVLSGKPLESGTFPFTLRLEDSSGQVDRNTFLLHVTPAGLQVLTGAQTALPEAVRGLPYDEELTASAPCSWSLVSGELPAGLELTRDGHLVAPQQVSPTASVGTYNFLVRVWDGQGGEGYGALTVTVPPPPEVSGAGGGGCSQTSAPTLLALLGLSMLLLPRRRALLLGALLLAPLAARAQTAAPVSEYFVVTQPEESYPEITEGTLLNLGSSTDTGDAEIVLPFAFNLFGDQVTTARVGIDGYLAFSGDGRQWRNQKLPNSTQPNGVVAPWWDDLQIKTNPAAPAPPTSFVQWKVEGEAPTRVAVVEWHNLTQLSANSTTGKEYTFQARLYEAGGISFHYKQGAGTAPKFSATVGVENMSGADGILALPCNDTCDAPAYPAGQTLRFVRQAELVVTAVTAPALAYATLPGAWSVGVRNVGALPAAGVSARLYLSADKTLDPESDLLLWEVGPVNLLKGEQKSFSAPDLRLPAEVAPGLYYPIAVVDPDGVVEEASEANNVLVGSALRVGEPAPDFVVQQVQASQESAQPGDQLTVTARLANLGNLEGTCRYQVVLSLNDVLSAADRAVGAGSVQLAAGAQEMVEVAVALPADLAPGTYRVGVLADPSVVPEEQVNEIEEFNNALKAERNLLVTSPLVIASESLPSATVGAFYSARLQGQGGSGLVLWSLVQQTGNKTPPGLTLSALGDLEGIPTQAGSFTFKVQLTASATNTTTKELSLRIDPAHLPLALLTSQLPAAIFGRAFEARLSAQGGTAPYVFRLKLAADRSGLPAGLALDPNGSIEGVPATSGDFPLTLEVEDKAGKKVQRDLTLHVLTPGRPVIDQRPLADAAVGSDYAAALLAVGGKAPYSWALEKVRRLADDRGDAGEELELVPGLVLAKDGKLSGTPREVGLYALDVKVTDAAGGIDRDTLVLVVRAEKGVALLTGQLPPATVGQPYDQLVVATGGEGALSFSLFDEAQPLPEGIELTSDGHLRGTPTQAGRKSFIVRVTDDARRSDVRALSLQVEEAPPADSGCSSTGAGTWAALLGLAALLLRRRRAPAAAALLPAFLLALLVQGCGSSASPKAPCEDVSCQPGEECDPTDGVCKCGERACTEEEACNPSARQCELLDRCKLVQCARGMTCDKADGECRCGASVCDASQVCDLSAGRCVVADRCAQVACAGGTLCDPADGVCKCGGAGGSQCGAGEVCEAGQCKADLCASVACTGGTVCDPADGQCHCGAAGGEQCFYGQTCLPTEKRCVSSIRCQAMRCAGGTSCDPADGVCKCGGAGGPTCQPSQTCDLALRECVGGNRCQNKVCSAGTTCDPEDGQCHCGTGGPVCADTQACVTTGTTQSCRTTCDVLTQAPCASDEACVYNTTLRTGLCGPAGARAEGVACTGSTDCARGLHCVTSGFSTVCRAYCPRSTSSTQCTPAVAGKTCKAFTGAPTDLGACMP